MFNPTLDQWKNITFWPQILPRISHPSHISIKYTFFLFWLVWKRVLKHVEVDKCLDDSFAECTMRILSPEENLVELETDLQTTHLDDTRVVSFEHRHQEPLSLFIVS